MQHSKEWVAQENGPLIEAEKHTKNWFGGTSSDREKELRTGFSLLDAFGKIDGRMRMLTRRDGTYVMGCSGMAHIFQMGTCLQLVDGTVRVVQPEYRNAWKKLIEVDAPNVGMLALPCRLTEGHLLIRAAAMCEGVTCFGLQHATEMIEPELPNLEELFKLTKTEAMIVHDLFLGHTPQQIADEHNNSIHTVRAHIRRCYDKLGITCREELWRKLNAYRLF